MSHKQSAAPEPFEEIVADAFPHHAMPCVLVDDEIYLFSVVYFDAMSTLQNTQRVILNRRECFVPAMMHCLFVLPHLFLSSMSRLSLYNRLETPQGVVLFFRGKKCPLSLFGCHFFFHCLQELRYQMVISIISMFCNLYKI